jgi:hypothetical protein
MVITVLYDLQIFSCPNNRNVTRVPCTATMKTEASGILITLGAICHRLEASSTEVTFGAIRCALSVRSSFTPMLTGPKFCRVVDFPCKKCEGMS